MQKINLLVVDDELLPIRALMEQLNETCYEVDYETDAKEALARLKETPERYAVVIVDRMMFGLDGMGLLNAMKQDPHLKNIPFIMQTGEAEPEEVEAALEAGANHVIFKPFNREDLLNLLASLTGSAP